MFVAALLCFLWLVPFEDFDTIIGDNIAQVGYWRVLFHRNLVGSIGASAMKPGLIVLLGIAYDLSQSVFGSAILIKWVFALAGAGLVTIVAKIARDAANGLAGIGAAVYLLVATPVPSMFTTGSSMIVFAPLLYWGIWCFSRGREKAGAVILCSAALMRIEALPVLFWLAVSQQLLRRNLRGLLFTGAVTALTCALTALVYYRVQGSVARFNIGPSVGYFFAHDIPFSDRLPRSLAYLCKSLYQISFKDCALPYLAVAAVIELAGNRQRRCYLSLLAIAIFLTAYAASGQGAAGARYFEFLIPLVAAFGAAGLAHPIRPADLRNARYTAVLCAIFLCLGFAALAFGARPILISAALVFALAAVTAFQRRFMAFVPGLLPKLGWVALIGVWFVHAVRAGAFWTPVRPAIFTSDARLLLDTSPIPRGTRVLTEDDVIYSVVVRDVGFFRRATALQYFNIEDDAARSKTLADTDYILVSKGLHSFYYLHYDPLKRGQSDPFRRAISHTVHGAFHMYGFLLTPVQNTRKWLLLKVEPQES